MIDDTNDEVIVRSTVDLGHNLGLTVVAEGVETLNARNRLMAMDCDSAQGHYFSQPLAPEHMLAFLNTNQAPSIAAKSMH
jgi:EAL domain-containing protein (putative c-di-GMP-specific phosphodiesterase class I)